MSTHGGYTKQSLIMGVFLFVTLLLIVSLTKSIWEVQSVYDRVADAEAEVLALEEKHRELEAELRLRQSPGYLERQIRDHLHLSQPGEYTVLVSDIREQVDFGSKTASRSTEMKPAWQAWWDLLAGVE